MHWQVIACVNLNGDLSELTEFPQLSDDTINLGSRNRHFFVTVYPHDPHCKCLTGSKSG
jgi:hypothetical protein